MLLDGAERLHDDAAGAEAAGDVRRPEVGEVAIGGHAGTLAADQDGPVGRLRRDVRAPLALRPGTDEDVIIIGAGHNGLVTAAYLARAGLRTLVLEARSIVGGTAASEAFAGARVNVCNCDHTTFRTTPVIDDLDLTARGLRYIDMEPSGTSGAWTGGPTWEHHHDVGRTLDELAATHPDEVAGYRRYVRVARPAVELILRAASEPPSVGALTRLAIRRRLAGVPTVLRWSRRSAADVIRSFFRDDAVVGPALVTGPMVWGMSPELPGTGLGAISYAMRHVGRVGRPVGGSGALTDALAAAVVHLGGAVRCDAPVAAVRSDGGRVAGVTLADGTDLSASVVVSACDPQRTFVQWLRNPPAVAADMLARWRGASSEPGYESKIDAVLDRLPVLRDGRSLSPTLTVAPTVAEMDRAAKLLSTGEVIERPALLANVPTIADPTMAPPGRHVFSLEVLLTPYARPGGWPGSPEPRRWLELFATRCEPGFLESIVDWRAMTPDVYEREFHLPDGHAASFAGGPLTALRSSQPELTRYETAVPGLFLTGAATFPGAGVWGASGRNCATVVLGRTA
jgi:beta-carotene ketolase (CrtO type)